MPLSVRRVVHVGVAGLCLECLVSPSLLRAQEPVLPAPPAPPAAGSILTPAPAPADAPPPPLWSGEGSLSYVQTTGNSENSTLGVGFRLLYQPALWKVEFRSAFVRNEADDVKSAERFNAGARAERSLGPRFAAYGQATFLRDVFAGIAGQESIEGGILYKLLASERQLFSVSTALGYTNESRVAPAPDRNFVAGRAALAYRLKIGKTSELTEDLDYLANFKQSGDWRVTNVAALSASVSKVFAMKLAHQVYYFHEPVPGKKNTDTTFLASLVAKWPVK